MVKISITPKRGNNTRFFPHHGYLGLSPVIISGTVSTRLEKDDQALEASKVVIRIRCYEGLGAHPGQGAGLGSDPSTSTTSTTTFKPPKINILWETEKTLWTPDQSNGPQDYGYLANTDTHWKLVIPVSATQRSLGGQAVGSMTYRTWKAWWQVEAVILHKPNGIYGSSILKTHPMFLPNYSRPIPTSLTHHQNVLQSTCSKFSYSITAPALIACGDLARVSISLSPLNSSSEPIVIKNLSVGLQRTLAVEFDPESDPTSNLLDSTPSSLGIGLPSAKRWKLRHLQARSRSTPTKPNSRLNCQSTNRHSSAISTQTTLVESDSVNSSDFLTISNSDAFSIREILLPIPKAKSRYHYSIGDSCQTKWVVVNYSLVVKVIIKSKSSGLETLSLNGLPVELMSVPNSELNLAIQSLRQTSSSSNPKHSDSHHPTQMNLEGNHELFKHELLHRLSTPTHPHPHHPHPHHLPDPSEIHQDQLLLEPLMKNRHLRLSAPPCNT
ncbi:hypothetical protein DFH28DRAFT_898229 [Melampsora americana]|nr:hypothetical protein DFH28DRAFT_898229 [Melampsora americana]